MRNKAPLSTRRDGGRIIGLGKFSSGVKDLGSNKRHLEGFGESRRPKPGTKLAKQRPDAEAAP